MMPVLVMTLTYSRFLSVLTLPSRQGGDLLAGMWQLISQVSAVSKTLVGTGRPRSAGRGRPRAAAAFAGILAIRRVLAPPRDPEFKGMTERNNGFFETSFLPGRQFRSPANLNTQLADWLPIANSPTLRSLSGRPVEVLDRYIPAMTALPPQPPATGPAHPGSTQAGVLSGSRGRLLRGPAGDRGGCHRDVDPGDRGLSRGCGRRPRNLLGDARGGHRRCPRDDREGAAFAVRRRQTRPGAGGAGHAGAADDVPGHLRLRRAVQRRLRPDHRGKCADGRHQVGLGAAGDHGAGGRARRTRSI